MRDNTTHEYRDGCRSSQTEDGVFNGLKVVRENRSNAHASSQGAGREERQPALRTRVQQERRRNPGRELEAIDRVLKAEREGGKLRGDDSRCRPSGPSGADDTQHVSNACSPRRRQALSAERSMAEISVFDSRNPVDVSKFDGS